MGEIIKRAARLIELQVLAVVDKPIEHPAQCAQRLLAARGGHLASERPPARRLGDDLLEGSRVNGGKFRLDRRHVGLVSLIDASIESCRAAMVNRGQTLIEQRPVPSGIPLVNGDAARLVQIFGNLLDIASKYTPASGTILLTLPNLKPRLRHLDAEIVRLVAARCTPYHLN